MFSNVGKKIQTLVKVLVWVAILAYVVCGFVYMFSEQMPVYDEYGRLTYDDMGNPITKHVVTFASFAGGLAIMALGAILSWVSSFFAFGFGKIVEWVEHPYIDDGGNMARKPDEKDIFTQTAEKMADKIVKRRAQKEQDRRVLEEYYANKQQNENIEEQHVESPKYKCPKCGEPVERGVERCAACNQKLRWSNTDKV